MSVLGKFQKQPADVLDYHISFVDWLAERSDSIAQATAQADDGLSVGSVTHLAGVVRVWLSGGTSGNSYKVTVTIQTNGGRTKQAEITIRVKDT